MKRLTLLLLVGLIGLTACSNDDDEKIKLNKLTKVTCYKNDSPTPYFQIEIFYNQDGTISRLQDLEKGKLEFTYLDKKRLTVSGPDSEKTEYLLNNNFITQMTSYALNPYAENAVYINEEYSYTYKRNKLSSADKLLRWPIENGLQYEIREYPGYDSYTWDGNNISRFSQEMKEMVYEYMPDKRPDNLPFMILNSFTPVDVEAFSPINYYRGALNTQLVSRIYWYNVPNANISAEYLFDYTFRNEYITTIFIEESDSTVNEGGTNTYTIYLEYNYQT